MSDFDMLTADERSLAQQFRLKEYFKLHRKYLLFITEMRQIMDKRFDGITQAHWIRNELADVAQEFLKRSEKLFEYVNDIYASHSEFRNIPAEDWERICTVSSKIIVCMGWKYEAKK